MSKDDIIAIELSRQQWQDIVDSLNVAADRTLYSMYLLDIAVIIEDILDGRKP